MTPFQLSILFFFQLAVILGTCRIVGWLGARIGQPQVVGEMVAGVLLGPSVLGVLAPEWEEKLFPIESKPILFAVSQVGLAIYMFLVGVEFDFELIQKRIRSAAAVSLSGILAPFSLGAVAAWYLAPRWPLFSAHTSVQEGMLSWEPPCPLLHFRCWHESFTRKLTGTSLGMLALAAGSIDDAAAWCVLAVVLASFTGNASTALLAMGGGLGYVALIRLAGSKLLRCIAQRVEQAGEISHSILGVTLCLVMLGAWFTDFVGIYAVFGAFVLGVAVPKGFFAKALHHHLEKMTTTFLLPLFFVYSGLNTKIGLIIAPYLLGITLLLLTLAILGKGVACTVAAWMHGEPPREALAIGVLMNARGLMELIILNIGLERGIITPALFSMMVVMAIMTTLMATPAFNLFYRGLPKMKTW